MNDKFIVNVCLTGIVPTKRMNPHLPVTPDEIARDVEACIKLGASLFHVHARDEEETPDWQKERFQSIFDAIRTVSKDVIICASTSGRRVQELSKRLACLETDPKPEMASLTMGSLNFLRDAGFNSPQTIISLLETMNARAIKPEIEVFDIGMARTVRRLAAEGVLRPPLYVNVLLGNIATADDSLLDLSAILQHLPSDTIWTTAGIGKTQLRANTLGLLYGHGIRVGLEDNLFLDRHKTPATNPLLVERIVQIGKHLGKSPYSIAETRTLLGL